MNKHVRYSLVIAIILSAIHVPAWAEPSITAIEISGNKHISERKIRRIFRLAPGDVYQEEKVAAAVKRLFATRELDDVKIFKEVVGEDVTLTIVVKEHLKIDDVYFEGNKHIDDEDLGEATSIKPGSFIRPALLRNDHQAIGDLYREKGYYRVRIEDDIRTESDKKTKQPKSVLVYNVLEGEKVSIKHIDFFGNRSVDSQEIREVLESKEDRWWRGAEFKPTVFEEDMDRVIGVYRDHGFLDAQVINKEMYFSEDGKDLDLFVTVDEGTRYEVGTVSWSGNEIFDDAQIRPLVTFHPGDVFNDSEFKEIQLAVNSLYWDRGYIYNSISPEKKVKGDVIDVEFEIVEGKPAHINEINITGNTKTAEKVIRRELIVNPGDVFLRPRLIRSLREVFNLGFFEGPPEVGTSTANEDGDINITLKVAEKQTGQFRMGAGFSALNSISGFLGLAETNFLGKGQTVGLDWEFSRTRQNVDLRFTEPWLMNTPTELSLNVFNRVQNQVSQQFYDDRRQGASIRIGRPFPWFDYTSIFWRYRLEAIELSNFSPLYIGPLRDVDWPQTTSSMSATLVRNSTDSPFLPTVGTRSSFTAELNGGPLGGDVKFQRYEAAISWYQTLFWKLVLQVGYSTAVLDGIEGSSVPDYELYRLGGNRRYGVRGYDFYEIVPDGNPLFLGGRYMHTLKYEIKVPIAPTVHALFFLDSGNTWNSFKGSDLFDMKKGVGFGIRIELPMLGTMGFDYGYGYDKPFGAGWEPHLTLGAGF